MAVDNRTIGKFQLTGIPPAVITSYSIHYTKLYEVISADLADRAERDAVLDRVGDGTALVITEGLLVYLEPSDVKELATALHAHPAVKEWILDLGSPT